MAKCFQAMRGAMEAVGGTALALELIYLLRELEKNADRVCYFDERPTQ